jgi:hypothetical protein
MAAGGRAEGSRVTNVNPMPPPAHSAEPARCESCGAPDDDLAPVHRVYVTPEAWDTDEQVEVVDDVERWCFPCRSSYPHQPLRA